MEAPQLKYKYILDGHEPVPVEDPLVWALWYENNRETCVVKQDRVAPMVHVSTVFLALDSDYGQVTPPKLFETMIFGGKDNGYRQRYATYEEAEAGHAELIKELLIAVNN